MSDIIRAFRARFAAEHPDVADLRTKNPTRHQHSGGLGPKQLSWCRENLANFAVLESQALAAREHSDRTRSAAETKRTD